MPNLTRRRCYLCGSSDNPIVAIEPAEVRAGRPLMPEGVYRFARCRACGTLYVDSDVTDEYLAGIYEGEIVTEGVDAVSERAAHEKIQQLRLPEFERHWQALRRLRPPRAGDHLLDVGCQMGDFGAVAQRDGVQPSGVELSRYYADACRTRWGADAMVHLGPVATADFGNRRFQYITAFETLEHVCDPVALLRDLGPWLAPDGVVAFSVPSSDYFHFKFWLLRKAPGARLLQRLFRRYRSFYSSQVLPHTHTYNFSQQSALMMASRAGLTPRVIELTGWHGPAGRIMPAVAAVLLRASGRRRVGFAPSWFVIGEPAGRG